MGYVARLLAQGAPASQFGIDAFLCSPFTDYAFDKSDIPKFPERESTRALNLIEFEEYLEPQPACPAMMPEQPSLSTPILPHMPQGSNISGADPMRTLVYHEVIRMGKKLALTFDVPEGRSPKSLCFGFTTDGFAGTVGIYRWAGHVLDCTARLAPSPIWEMPVKVPALNKEIFELCLDGFGLSCEGAIAGAYAIVWYAEHGSRSKLAFLPGINPNPRVPTAALDLSEHGCRQMSEGGVPAFQVRFHELHTEQTKVEICTDAKDAAKDALPLFKEYPRHDVMLATPSFLSL